MWFSSPWNRANQDPGLGLSSEKSAHQPAPLPGPLLQLQTPLGWCPPCCQSEPALLCCHQPSRASIRQGPLESSGPRSLQRLPAPSRRSLWTSQGAFSVPLSLRPPWSPSDPYPWSGLAREWALGSLSKKRPASSDLRCPVFQ